MPRQKMVTNKFLIMNNCNKCLTEGLISKCCTSAVTFTANGAAKCTQCKKFTKLIYCNQCKEEPTTQNNNTIQTNKITKQPIIITITILSLATIAYLIYLAK